MAEKKSAAASGGGSRRRRAPKTADPRTTIVAAMLDLVVETGWRQLSLAELSRRSGVPLATIRAHYATKADILTDWMKRVDEQALARIAEEGDDAGAEPRDRLFEAIMARLDVLTPHRASLRAILRDLGDTPTDWAPLACGALVSQRWILAGAGAESPGLHGAVKVAGLGFVYMRTLRVWLEEADPGWPKTMATLDESLRRGETALRRAEVPMALGRTFCSFVRAFRDEARRRRRPAAGGSPPAPEGAEPS